MDRTPNCCQYCGVALEWYGEWNGIIGWHSNMHGMTSYLSDTCGGCCARMMRGKKLKPRDDYKSEIYGLRNVKSTM